MSWRAELSLNYRLIDGRLSYHAKHQGPLAVQKPYYFDQQKALHHYILHPPGGLVGLDELHTTVSIQGSPHVLLTSPSAQKVYRSAKKPVQVHSVSHIDTGTVYSWLPQETILFGGSHYRSTNAFHLSQSSTLVFWDIFVFGRPAIGEAFGQSSLDTRVVINVAGRPIVNDRLQLDPHDELLKHQSGLNGFSCYGQLYMYGPGIQEHFAGQTLEQKPTSAWSLYDNLLSARILGSSAYDVRDQLHQYIANFFQSSGQTYQQPRIWAC